MKPDGPTRKKPRRPLIVLVDSGKREYHDALTAAGYNVVGVSSTKEALSHRPRPDALILELVVPDDELASLRTWKSGRRTRAMTLIALASAARQEAILKVGATFCRYPCPPEELVEVLRKVIPLPNL
ncbi:MAG TPA: hypothetical protein VGA78_09945 [Gemmatimonadales bacterium]